MRYLFNFLTTKPTKLLFPALFLLFLGIGNIMVGDLKAQQYSKVIEELKATDPIEPYDVASILNRIQLSEHTATRLYQRQEKARARQDFYSFVVFGGQVFIGLSITLFTLIATFKTINLTSKKS